MAAPIIAVAPAIAPAVGEGLLLGAGALGSGLAAIGIIENKDAIKEGLSSIGTSVKRGIKNRIRALSKAMSPILPTENVHIDRATGSYIATPDAISVLGLDQYFMPTSKKKKDAAPAASTGTGSSTVAPAPNPKNDNDSTKVGPIRRVIRLLKPFSGYKNGSVWGNIGRIVRDAPVAGFAGDILYNGYYDATVPNYEWQFPLTKITTIPERMPIKFIGSMYKLPKSPAEERSEPDSTVETQLSAPTDTFTRAPMALPDTARVRNGIVFVSD